MTPVAALEATAGSGADALLRVRLAGGDGHGAPSAEVRQVLADLVGISDWPAAAVPGSSAAAGRTGDRSSEYAVWLPSLTEAARVLFAIAARLGPADSALLATREEQGGAESGDSTGGLDGAWAATPPGAVVLSSGAAVVIGPLLRADLDLVVFAPGTAVARRVADGAHIYRLRASGQPGGPPSGELDWARRLLHRQACRPAPWHAALAGERELPRVIAVRAAVPDALEHTLAEIGLHAHAAGAALLRGRSRGDEPFSLITDICAGQVVDRGVPELRALLAGELAAVRQHVPAVARQLGLPAHGRPGGPGEVFDVLDRTLRSIVGVRRSMLLAGDFDLVDSASRVLVERLLLGRPVRRLSIVVGVSSIGRGDDSLSRLLRLLPPAEVVRVAA